MCVCVSVVCKKRRRRSGKDFLKGVVRQVLTCLSQHWLPSVTVARLCWHRPFSVSFTLTFRLTNRHTLLFYHLCKCFCSSSTHINSSYSHQSVCVPCGVLCCFRCFPQANTILGQMNVSSLVFPEGFY